MRRKGNYCGDISIWWNDVGGWMEKKVVMEWLKLKKEGKKKELSLGEGYCPISGQTLVLFFFSGVHTIEFI